MIIGAMARMGMVCEAIAHGITLISMALLWTIPTASKIPASVPITKPASVAERVIQPWKIRLRLDQVLPANTLAPVVFHNSRST